MRPSVRPRQSTAETLARPRFGFSLRKNPCRNNLRMNQSPVYVRSSFPFVFFPSSSVRTRELKVEPSGEPGGRAPIPMAPRPIPSTDLAAPPSALRSQLAQSFKQNELKNFLLAIHHEEWSQISYCLSARFIIARDGIICSCIAPVGVAVGRAVIRRPGGPPSKLL
jgi:hypothetical protein